MLLQLHLRPELRTRLKEPEKFRLDPPPFHVPTLIVPAISAPRLVAPAGFVEIIEPGFIATRD